MIEYILKFSACLAVFMLFYKLFLEKESFHKFKRFYLLGTLLLAAIIPLITFTTYVDVAPLEIPVYNSEIGTPPYVPELMLEEPVNYWSKILWSIYGIGVLIFAIRFGMNLRNIFKRIKHNPKFKNQSIFHVLLNDSVQPHTFLNYIFFNKSKYEAHEIPKEVILHEETHAIEKHALDILFIEVLQIIYWFNPLLYFIKKDIKLNHEFLADQAVINHGFEIKSYQNTLLAFSSNAQEPQLANAINYSSIKKRFTVMKTHTSKTKTWLKSIVLLPLLAILIYSFSTKKEVIENSSNSVANSNTFTITIEKDNNELKLSCLEGCAWKELTFKDTQNNSNIIDFYGVSSEKSDDNSDFAFIVESKNNGVNLKSLKGTAWTDLSFTLSSDGKQVIDKNGMVTLKTKNNSYPSSKTDEKQTEIPKLELEQNPLKLILNGKETSLNTLKDDFSKVTNGQKSDLFIDSKGVNIKIETLEKITKEIEINLVKAILSDGVVHDSSKTELIKNDNGSISFKSLQKGASKEQIAEYNKLAKYYNSQKGSDYTIKLSDMKRLKYLYELMTEEQRKSAEPFPNFPPPPPPAPAPESVSKKERAEYESMAKKAKAGKAYSYKYKDKSGKVIKVKVSEENEKNPPTKKEVDAYNTWAKKIHSKSTTISNKATLLPIVDEQKLIKYSDIYNRMSMKQKNESVKFPFPGLNTKENNPNSPLAPPPPPPPVPADATPEQKEKYQKISEEYYKNYKVENGKVSERVPPPPPPKSPLDHVIDMAKKGATFYYEGKQISSDKAIEILKTDKSMNISTKNSNSKNPKVYLSKEPITIKNK
ncbi:M56 family metallopeptidase [Hanstruepera ponticola]|uniref:M56 family metallopeptidase n=1 Tax=Hanstruepera ponticola TaxID=2042995 RepID=UPI000CF09226|nr:M56 family metallopeptidase [Hanstruepera ponticola]